MELYILRHGQNTTNVSGDLGQSNDGLLTEIGVEQAELVSRFLALGGHLEKRTSMEELDTDRPLIDHLYCSPMKRALQTARPIGRELGLNPEVWVDLHETGGLFIDYGENRGVEGLPGQARDEILQEFPNFVLPKDITDEGWWKGSGWEEWPASVKRAYRVAEQLGAWPQSMTVSPLCPMEVLLICCCM